ncbi:flavin reductase family protein [Amycolatopsis sp. NPDC049253]|uniref:flavin reductase family protein n=1 Tax=Amycolatopsis sp. NPDC049253 TaxID=3155274 RepID=UPI0034170D58
MKRDRRPLRSTWPALRRAPHLGVTGLSLTTTAHGAITLDDGVAWFDTTIECAVAAGDHTLVLLRLHSAAHAEDAAPLVFHRSGFRQAV